MDKHPPLETPRSSAERILLVDDDREMLTGLRLLLENAGFEVFTAQDGQEALALLKCIPHPHLIVSDLLMPKLNGWELSRHLSTDEELSEIPLIVLSAFPKLSRAVHCDCILKKSQVLSALVPTIKELLVKKSD